jgi:uncharacterized protein (TIGR03437 family)
MRPLLLSFLLASSLAAQTAGSSNTTLAARIADDAVLLTAVVTSAAAVPPAGTVSIQDITAGKTLGSGALTAGSFTIELQAPPVGHTIQAFYSGDTAYVGSASAAQVLIAAVNSFSGKLSPLAPDQFVTIYGSGFVTVADPGTALLRQSALGTTVTLTDAAGNDHLATVLYVSDWQLNFLVPADVPPGAAQIAANTASGATFTLGASIALVSPGLATADGTFALGEFVITHSDGSQGSSAPTATYNQSTSSWTLDPPAWNSTDQISVVLYATGFRHATAAITCDLAGQTILPSHSGPANAFPGLDQIEIAIPANLRDAGAVKLSCTADGVSSNKTNIAL